MKHRALALAIWSVVALAACDSPSTVLLQPLDDDAVAQLAEVTSEDAAIHLPSMGALLAASRRAIREQDGNQEAVDHFRRAHRLALAAEVAWDEGRDEEARSLEAQSYRHRLAGIVAALGEGAVAEAVEGSAAGLARIRGHIEGRDVSERVAMAVERIAAQVLAAQGALEDGAPVAALHHALEAAEGIRHLSPRYVARKWIERATAMLREARQAVGDAATEEELSALRRAWRLLNVAREELASGHPIRAVEAAKRSARLSWGVLEGRSGG
jgi:hypothetical protein